MTGLLGVDAEPHDLASRVGALDGDGVIALLRSADALARGAERIRVVAAGVVSARSAREAGHAGLAQSLGHRTPASLVQEVTGGSRADAVKQMRVGESLLSTALLSTAPVTPPGGSDADGADAPAPAEAPWHAPLSQAMLTGVLSTAQHDAIRRGLGEPPVIRADEMTADAEADAGAVAAARAEACRAWSLAAAGLITEARSRTVEELGRQARSIRDLLDPEGAVRRFQERFEARSFRIWTDADGIQHGSFIFDDEAATWIRTIIDAALRPRRGGPRFIDPDEKAQAGNLIADPRSNDQLTHDLLIDLLRAGALADAQTVFGTRQAGVRLVRVIHDDAPAPIGHTEDHLVTLPAATIDQHICDTGVVPVTVDPDGNPLDVGREHRLFTPRQRIALATRDGGCRWTGCDRPASSCEAHHIDEWAAHHGSTDTARGILLCRFHHMNLHHHRHRITRHGTGDFTLHTPDGTEHVLKPRAQLTHAWAWTAIDPPPRRFRVASQMM